MSKDKGQVFTLDVLAAILGITILLGITVQYQGMIKNTGSQLQYQEMKTIASDAAQITVKRTAIKENHPNTISTNADLEPLMENLTTQKYNYEVKGPIQLNNGACNNAEETATSRRIIKNQSNQIQSLTVVICNE